MNASRALYRFCSGLGAALFVLLLMMPGRAGQDVAQTRDVRGFDHVRLEGAFATSIASGARSAHVVITASPDSLDKITTTVDHGSLVVSMKGNWSSNVIPRLAIALPVLRGFREEGAGETKITGLAGGELSIEAAGAGSIVAMGRVARLTIALDGAGKVDTTAVDARDVTVANNGVGSVRVRASDSLSATLDGVGSILYTGTVTNVHSSMNGVGSIRRI